MARITLRKVLKLRKELEAALAKTRPSVTVSLSVLDPNFIRFPAHALSAAAKVLEAETERYERLAGILTTIRTAVGRSNVESGVDLLLAQVADLDRHIRFQGEIVSAVEADTAEVLAARLEHALKAYKEPQSELYGRRSESRESVQVAVVSHERRERAADRLAELKRARSALDDQRLALNASVSIEIADDAIAFLREERFDV